MKTLFLLTLTLLMSACSVVERQYGYIESQPKKYSPTNYHEVLTNMGAPDSIATLDDHFVFVYHSIFIIEPQIGFTIPNSELFKFSMGKATAKHTYHFYAFNLNGNIINDRQFFWHNNLGDGSALGFVFSVDETVDLTVFRDAREANLWGKQLLLKKAIIAEHNLDEVILGKRLDVVGQSF